MPPPSHETNRIREFSLLRYPLWGGNLDLANSVSSMRLTTGTSMTLSSSSLSVMQSALQSSFACN